MHSADEDELPDTGFKSLLKEGETFTSSTPYLSPLVTLSVGPESDTAKPTVFYVHQDKLKDMPFFVAALRPDAFIEGKELKISFPDEDPFVFARLVEFVYETNMFPRADYKFLPNNHISLTSMEPRPWIVRPCGGGAQEYVFALHESSVMCGLLVSTQETFKLFEMVVQVMCLSDKYGHEHLTDHCLNTLAFFPMGTKEVALLAKNVLERIADTHEDVYNFLYAQLRLHRLRLASCPAFQALQDSDNPLVYQGLMKALINHNFPGPEFTPYGSEYRYVICVRDVTIDESIEAYGAIQPKGLYDGNDDDGYTAGFGVALRGEVLVITGRLDERKFFIALNTRILVTPKVGDEPLHGIHGLSYPADRFRWLFGHDRFL